MRKWTAEILLRLATWVHNGNHTEQIEIHDEYGVLRCRVELAGDEHHGVDAALFRLPAGWNYSVLGNTHDFKLGNI